MTKNFLSKLAWYIIGVATGLALAALVVQAEEVRVSAKVNDSTHKYVLDLVQDRDAWVEEYFIDDSRCWVHWSPCEDIQMCIRDAVFCIPNN